VGQPILAAATFQAALYHTLPAREPAKSQLRAELPAPRAQSSLLAMALKHSPSDLIFHRLFILLKSFPA
jgi:hypothetical protein